MFVPYAKASVMWKVACFKTGLEYEFETLGRIHADGLSGETLAQNFGVLADTQVGDGCFIASSKCRL
jgi:hypothetical protein